ncbi:alanine racemase [Nocardia callitridis]|uniref:Y4yA family PLP-dependent enzyme n=1 Tax=Nocardia callitridis TaxID=648753 RepID=A0ABP9K1V5_9NOCA
MPTSPALPAKLAPVVRAFLDRRDLLDHALRTNGSPLHLLFPQVVADNLAALRAVLDAHPLRYRLCYAHKVNHSRAFVRTVEHAGIDIDVASPQELAAAHTAGFSCDRIEVTGPKGAALLRAALAASATVNVDNAWELSRIAELADTGNPVRVLLRVNGFDPPGANASISRFGFAPHQLDGAFELLAAQRNRIRFLGFAFHLDSGAIADRVRAIDGCLTLVERAAAYGLTAAVLDIGGGFRQVFTADVDRFDRYTKALRAALVGHATPMSWGNNTFGYRIDAQAVHGIPIFHKYANTVESTAMLAELLATPLPRHGARTIAEVLADNLLEVWAEPGKSLVDHAGVTLATVEFVKEAADGSLLVHLDLSRDRVTPADQEVMVDPILLPDHTDDTDDTDHETETDSVGVYFAGQLCLERDMITTHKVWLPRRPRTGDLVVFPNTAAYNMDLSSASASMRPPPPKLAVTRNGDDFRVVPDADYRPSGDVDTHGRC